MESLEMDILGLVSSSTRMQICDLLSKGVDHPDELAKRLKLRRQSVDKHLLALYRMGIVDRSAVFDSDRRPRIVYSVSSPASLLIGRIVEALRLYAMTKANEYRESLLTLDDDLSAGRLDEQVYEQQREALERQYFEFLAWEKERQKR
ncbi:MAG: winged helix-turn-helix domain-containing protein [Candidatus Thermoplasmatota archaeon]|nr:winged helix-turn-helix domain-containing protein [Candidatus Thermoplasmatota archaeon]